jgi:gamma-glutamylcyclotransferase
MQVVPGRFLYFAYGSNMLSNRLKGRCESAQSLGAAKLEGYQLRWDKRSNDDSAKCSIQQGSKTELVWGVLYTILETERPNLNKAEGLNNGYNSLNVEVIFKDERLAVATYQADHADHSLLPYSWYKSLVIAGAKENSLPSRYIETLRAVQAQEDNSRQRHEKGMSWIPTDLRE